MASCNPADLLAAGKCFDCLSPGLKETAKLQLLCEIANGGGGGSGITSLTGDVTATGPGAAAATIAAGAVTLAKMANIATNTVIGRSTAGTGAPEALTSITPASAAFSGTAGAGFVSLLTQSSVPAAPATGFALYADSSGRLSWRRATDGFTRSFDVTATANRTFTLPDASFTFAGQNLANTFTLANTFSANGALSAPAVSFTGTPITGGTATTTKPMVLIETAGATSAAWHTSGTMLGVNAPSGFAGDIFSVNLNGYQYAWVTSGGVLRILQGGYYQIGTDTTLSRKAAANLQLGASDAAAPVAQTLSVQSVVAGTSNTAGATYTRITSLGTGTGGGGDDVLKQGITGSSGTTQNTAGTRMYRRAKETTLTEATATKLFTVPLAAGGYIGMTITATVFASDGTDHQTITSTLNVNAVAKSTTITGTITQVDGTAANSSGTLTPVTYTVVDDGSNVLSVKCAATSSLTQTVLSCKWSITMLNSNVSATITPL